VRPGPLSPLLCGRDGAPWLEEPGRVWTRAQARRAVVQVAARLREAGLAPGQRLAWLPRTRAQGLFTALGALEAGAELVLLPLRETEEGRARELARLAPRMLARDDGRLESFGGAAAAGVPGRVWLRSSGSLGRPAWLAHDLDRLLAGARAAGARLGLTAARRWWLSLPLDHVGGLGVLLRGLACGCRLALPGEEGSGPFQDGDWLSLVPAQLERLMAREASPAGLAGVLLGGAPLPASLAEQARRAGWPLWTSYGATETGALVCAEPWRPGGGSGRPFPPHRLHLDPQGRIRVASPCLWTAELDGEGRVQPCGDGAWRSGDLGAWDSGSLRVLGRVDRVLNSGGEKIPAERVEEVLAGMPGVLRAVVVPWPDERFGQRPAAYLALEEGMPGGVEALAGWLDGRLPRHMWPVRLLPWPDDLDLSWKPPLAELARRAARLAEEELRRRG